MDINNMEHSPAKTLLHNAHKKFSNNIFNCNSPFRVLPNITSTPPSSKTNIRNPFETVLLDKLHTQFMSPTVFATRCTPKSEQKFKWTIEEIGNLKPADIDITSIDQCYSSETDTAMELHIQEKIDKFFSLNEVIASPSLQERNSNENPKNRIVNNEDKISKKDCETQTALSLPLVLPDKLEEALKPYFSPQTETNICNTNVGFYKQLFEFESGTESINSSPAKSIILSPVNCSPIISKGTQSKSHSINDFIDCIASPLSMNLDDISHDLRSPMQLDFSNFLPNSDEKINMHEAISDTETTSNTSLENWDIEFVQIKNVDVNKMSILSEIDVNNSNTPRTKLFSNQRKKLADNFLMDCSDGKENILPEDNKIILENDSDFGYCSNTGTFYEDSTLNMSHLSASTPNKITQKIQ